jgi:small subunit ribosomal protein S7
MPRKGPAPRRELLPDPIYRSVLVTQIVNKIMQRGKRSTAEKIVYDALDMIERRPAPSRSRRSSVRSTTSSRSSR